MDSVVWGMVYSGNYDLPHRLPKKGLDNDSPKEVYLVLKWLTRLGLAKKAYDWWKNRKHRT